MGDLFRGTPDYFILTSRTQGGGDHGFCDDDTQALVLKKCGDGGKVVSKIA